MAKVHINSNGEPGVCKATTGVCPFGAADTHFESTAEAAVAYETAQNAMGNGINPRVTDTDGNYEDDANYARFDSKEEALKIANIISNEGKFAGIVTVTTTWSERPDEDDYEDNDDYEEAKEEYLDAFYDHNVEAVSTDIEYFVRGFDEWDDRNKISADAWAPSAQNLDEIDFHLEGKPTDVYEMDPTDDYMNDRQWQTTVEFVSPKTK